MSVGHVSVGTALLDGQPLDLGASRIAGFLHEREVTSTMDVAHRLAADGASAGTVVVADVQTAGRGRGGNAWVSEAGDGLWFTLLERNVSATALAVLSLRAGLAIARVVAPWCDDRVGLKWPNDVLVLPSDHADAPTASLRKLAGVLVEARWREGELDWVAIGLGVNLREPARALPGRQAAALRDGAGRAMLLSALVPALRAAAADAQELRAAELREWAARDVMRGRACVAPAMGVVQGIAADGALRIATGAAGTEVVSCRSGSLVLSEEVRAC